MKQLRTPCPESAGSSPVAPGLLNNKASTGKIPVGAFCVSAGLYKKTSYKNRLGRNPKGGFLFCGDIVEGSENQCHDHYPNVGVSKSVLSRIRSKEQRSLYASESLRKLERLLGSIKPCRLLRAITNCGRPLAVALVILSSTFSIASASPIEGTASWYSTECCKYNPSKGCPTASGASLYALEERGVKYAASWDYPFGTRLKVTNLENGQSTTVTILDRGPAKRLKRVIDLSKKAFQEISTEKKGLIKVRIERIK